MKPASPADELARADRLLRELGQAAYALGVILPSTGIDMASSTPLIELGRINLDTAERLVKALRAAGRHP